MENSEPPGPLTRRATKALEEAKRVEEQQLFDEFPHVMMVGPDEEVRQRATDKVHDEGRLQMDAILSGEVEEGDIKKEVVEEEPDEGRHEVDPLQQDDDVGDVFIKKEGEEMLETNTVGVLAEGQGVVIPTDLLQELEVKDEDEGGRLLSSGGGGEGEGAEKRPILLDVEDEEVMSHVQSGQWGFIKYRPPKKKPNIDQII